MSKYEDVLNRLNNENKIIYYDPSNFLHYNLSLSKEDKDKLLKKIDALYTSSFIDNLPDYKIFGTKIKDLIKFSFSNGNCHFCSFILSLCFDDFEIETANLYNYAKHHNNDPLKDEYWEDFIHSFLIVKYNDEKYVIDTTFGFITKYKDYKELFDLRDEHVYSSELVRSTLLYKYLDFYKNSDDKLNKSELYQYLSLCEEYHGDDKKFQYFINLDMRWPFFLKDYSNWDESVGYIEDVVPNSSEEELNKSDVYRLIRDINKKDV